MPKLKTEKVELKVVSSYFALHFECGCMFRYGANNERLFQVICANHHPIKKEVIEEVEAIVNDES